MTVEKAHGEKCERCWIYSETVGSDAEHPTLCARCANEIKQFLTGKLRTFSARNLLEFGGKMVYIALLVSLLLIGVDQFFKYLVVTKMYEYEAIPFIKIGDTEILNLTYVQNRGAAFGSFENMQIFLIIITAILIVAGIYLLISKKVNKPFLIWTIALIIAGGTGNLIDRIFRGELFAGYVVDYIEIKLFKFAVFNFADICVVVGAFMLIIYTIVSENKSSKKEKITDESD